MLSNISPHYSDPGVYAVENMFASNENIKTIIKETFELGSC